MKPEQKNSDETLDKALALFNDPPAASMESARDRVSQRLDSVHDYRDAHADIPLVRPIRKIRWPAVAGIAAAIIVAVLVPATALRSAPAILQDAAGSHAIRYGEVVRPNGERGGTLTLANGTRVEMRSESELSLERADDGVRVHLRKGDVIVDAAEQLQVKTKDISAVGKIFLVNTKEEGSRVAAIEGEAQVQQGTSAQTLLPGERAVTNPNVEWRPAAEEVSGWTFRAGTRLTQLVQATPAPVSPNPGEAFEVTSVKPTQSGPRGARGPLMSPCNGAGPRIDPGRFTVLYISVYRLISWAYGKECPFGNRPELISGGPSWIRTEPFAIEGVMPAGSPSYTAQDLLRGAAPKLQKMLQTLLAERFKLSVRSEAKDMPIYNLVMGKDTGRMKLSEDQSPPEPSAMANGSRRGTFSFSTDRATGVATLSANAVQIQTLLDTWLPLIDRPVVNKTDMKGLYDIAPFQFTLDGSTPAAGGTTIGFNGGVSSIGGSFRGGSYVDRPQVIQIFEQLGFRFEPSKAPMELLIVDHVEKPSEN